MKKTNQKTKIIFILFLTILSLKSKIYYVEKHCKL